MTGQDLMNCVQGLKAVCVFAGDIVPDALKAGGWRSLRGTESDKTGSCPSLERVLAAAALWEMNRELILVPSGGVTNVPEFGESPPISAVISRELQELGVPLANILEEPRAFNTAQQVELCAAVARECGWDASEVAITSLSFHSGRIIGLIANLEADTSPFVPFVTPFISTERALAAVDPEKWNAYFKELYESPGMARTIMGEALGTGQILSGHQPRFPQPFTGCRDPLG